MIRAGLVTAVAAGVDGGLVDEHIAYVTVRRVVPHAVRPRLPGARGAALPREAAQGRAARARHRPADDQEARRRRRTRTQLRKRLALRGDEEATLVLTRVAGQGTACWCARSELQLEVARPLELEAHSEVLNVGTDTTASYGRTRQNGHRDRREHRRHRRSSPATRTTTRHAPRSSAPARPAVVLRPRTAAEVAASLRHARAEGLPVAIRSGGHNALGFGNIDGGAVLDLSRLDAGRAARRRPGAHRRRRRPGARPRRRWRSTASRSPPATRSSVGVGGLTQAGGIGWMVRKHGLTIDSLLAAEVVTAAGDVVRASATAACRPVLGPARRCGATSAWSPRSSSRPSRSRPCTSARSRSRSTTWPSCSRAGPPPCAAPRTS